MQPPFKVDQLQVAPGDAGTRTIQRDAAAGALSFTDPVSGTLLLSQLAGLRNVTGVAVVGRGGTGAQYTSIQDALDAVPSNASPTSPWLVLVLPGAYTEALVVEKDSVTIYGLGSVVVTAPADEHTLTIQAGAGTTPLTTELHNLTLVNGQAAKACLRVIGGPGSTVEQNGLRLHNCTLQANSGAGNYALWANAAGSLWLYDCRYPDSGLALILVQECSGLWFEGQSRLPALQLRYDEGQDAPAGGPGVYRLADCKVGQGSSRNPVLDLTFVGSGDWDARHVYVSGQTHVHGDRTVKFPQCHFGDNVTLTDEVYFWYDEGISGGLIAGVNCSVAPLQTSGYLSFQNETTKSVVFSTPLAATYDIALELNSTVGGDVPWISGKTENGFTVNFNTAKTLTFMYSMRRR